ncbi:ATP-dependent RNA helicase HrpA [Accumulibacter sp.]|uniref:ATP-dependent RNA helicase HrpA n=1 Tax=Accumulibacter sp. TaxID=2053492 RepID=UPI0025D7998D|nr:ATP-dependent RNA helicase HrpA [Accumulibacter sp.]MCM8594749.1 ATP-dependent RNA helicase HrpA [Accumulibacter sp.]MDS4048895.1 ATP-dependent RNA helicase HrpA [Accumulibacter sp.]
MRPRSSAIQDSDAEPFADCLAADQRRLRALTRDLRHAFGERRDALLGERARLVEKSRAAVAARRSRLPAPEFADELPISGRREEIARLVAAHQVVVVCGETGSGKTTQLPKICLELARGTRGLIGHTQPRRIAARSTAARIAQELHSEPGELVGYKIRFTDRTSPGAFVKLMTDGILLAETQGDRWLEQYDTLIIDEAHERSLNIDFLLGYLRQLLPRRRDLKLIITSATIDADRFSRHFSGAPVIEVSGRLHPVEIRYRPLGRLGDDAADDERDLYEAITDACDELHAVGPGDVLVFLPGEREIREAANALRQHHPPHTEILPLYSRLSTEEQNRVFRPHLGRRIVLATNVAETSLTVPGIRYVVDSGLARVKRYSYRNKVEQLQVEKIAQASASQRAGRCGRVAAGVCIRLYEEQDLALRPAYPDPEILRSSLAGVILRMKTLNLGAVEDFPFIEAPPQRAISDAYQALLELGAIDREHALTPLGQELARMPLDPRLGRMIVAARDAGCLREVLVITAALAVQDPRERPQERQGTADAAHRRFLDERSEFVGWVKLWDWYQAEIENGRSRRKLAECCRENFLSPVRMREWRDIHGQLRTLAVEHGWRENDLPASHEAIHRALLSGLLGNVGCKSEESGHYLGARGIRFLIHPGSPLVRKSGKWIVAAEISETTRLFARCIARVEVDWIEQAGAHLLKRSSFDPHWEKRAMQAVAFERITLYGLIIDPRRRVSFAELNPAAAREIFIRQALVGGEVSDEFARRWDFFRHNQQLIVDIETLEHKSRRPDVLVDDELIFAFYDRLIPEAISSGTAFDSWRREAERDNPRLLYLQREDLMRHQAAGVTSEAFPPRLRLGGADYELAYHFEPGSPRDGVTMTIPLAQLNQIPAARCEWLVPGLLREKVVQLVRTLPQRIRSKLVPVPDFADDFVARVAPSDKALVASLIGFILETRGLNARGWEITPDAFRPDALAAHLFLNFRLVDDKGRQLAMSRRLNELRAEWGREAKQEFSGLHEAPRAFSRMTDWSFGELPELMEVDAGGGQRLVGYPGLVDQGDGVSLSVFDSADEARRVHVAGLLRLFLLHFREQTRYLEKSLPGFLQMAVDFMPLGTADELRHQLIELTVTRACLREPWPHDEPSFRARCHDARPRLTLLAQEICRLVGQILGSWRALQKKLPAFRAFPRVVQDVEQQLGRLIRTRFVVDTPFERLQHFPRYLQAVASRLDRLKAAGSLGAQRDERLLAEFLPLWSNYERRATLRAKQNVVEPALEQFRWLLEELRVQLFAQELRTPVPVSSKRLQKIWEAI